MAAHLLIWLFTLAPPRVTLVSIGFGAKFERALRPMSQTAAAAGFDRVQFWRDKAALLADPFAREHAREMAALAAHRGRPWCMVGKGIALLRAMADSQDGDYVMWADASKYHSTSLAGVDVRQAIASLNEPRPRLEQSALPATSAWAQWLRTPSARTDWSQPTPQAPRSAFGLLACPYDCRKQLCITNSDRTAFGKALVSARTVTAYARRIGNASTFLGQPHVLNSNILLHVDSQTRSIVREWVQMAWDSPEGFCGSHPQDQSAWSVLVHSLGLPLINVCAYTDAHDPSRRGYRHCHWMTKGTSFMLRALAARNFSILKSAQPMAAGESPVYLPSCTPRLDLKDGIRLR